MNPNVGLRTDLRYIRTFGRTDIDISDVIERVSRLDFARASAGLIVGFGADTPRHIPSSRYS